MSDIEINNTDMIHDRLVDLKDEFTKEIDEIKQTQNMGKINAIVNEMYSKISDLDEEVHRFDWSIRHLAERFDVPVLRVYDTYDLIKLIESKIDEEELEKQHEAEEREKRRENIEHAVVLACLIAATVFFTVICALILMTAVL